MNRLHNLNNPNTPLPLSGNELADVIKNAATGALEVLQQSYSMPNFCEPPCLAPVSSPPLLRSLSPQQMQQAAVS